MKPGNPEIKKYAYKPTGEKALEGHLQIKIEMSDLIELKQIPYWRNLLRAAIKQVIANKS